MRRSGRTAILLGVAFLATCCLAAGRQAGARFESRFDQLDRNGDGALTRAEVPWVQFITRADADGDGAVTLEEARDALMTMFGRGSDALPEGGTKHADIAYASIDGVAPRHLSLDLYVPDGAEGAPIMLFVHGGGWARGDRANVARKPEYFCGNGWLLASANYRFVPQVTPAEQVRDVARAIAWLHEHAEEYGGDPERIFISGHSAGGHLVALVSTWPEPLREVGLDLSAISGTICLDAGALDLEQHMLNARGRGIFADAFGSDPEFWREVSPMAHIAPDTGIPPFLVLVQGGQRRLDGAQRFVDALTAAGVPAEVVYLPDHSHATVNRNVGLPGDPTTEAIERFLRRNGAPVH